MNRKIHLLTSLPRMRQLAPWALVLVSAVIAVGAYQQALNYQFFSDDAVYITENTKLLGLHYTELWRLFTEPYNPVSEFLPLRELSYWFDITLFGLNPAAFRTDNIILYLFCLPLVYTTTLSLWRYFRPADSASAPWAAAAVTALFALHPTLVESVVWISGRKYVLPNLFAMLALWLAVSAKREQGLSVPHAAAALLAFVAVMLSKASYVAMAPVIALLWVMFWRDIPAQGRRRSQLLWPLAILVLAVILVLVFIVSSVGRQPVYFGIEVVTRTLAVLGWLARLAVSPESRHFFYPVFEDPYYPVMIALGVAVFAAAAVGMVMMLRKRSLEGFAIVAFLLLCMPYIQLIPYVPPSLVSDRFLALAAWPVVLLIVAFVWRLKPVPRMVTLLVIVLSWGFQTVERPRDWQSAEVLMDVDLQAYPGNYQPAYFKIMIYQLPKGRFREASELANNITMLEARNIMSNLVEVAIDLRDANISHNPHDAMIHLQNLESLLKQPPIQIKWDQTLVHFWIESRNSFLIEWKWLVKSFPDDGVVRENARLSLGSILKYENAALPAIQIMQ